MFEGKEGRARARGLVDAPGVRGRGAPQAAAAMGDRAATNFLLGLGDEGAVLRWDRVVLEDGHDALQVLSLDRIPECGWSVAVTG